MVNGRLRKLCGVLGLLERQKASSLVGAFYSTGLQPVERDVVEAENLAKAIPPRFGSYVPDIVSAIPREKAGTSASEKIRKLRQVPSVIFGLPGNQQRLISLQRNEINKYIRQYRPSGVASRLFYVRVTEEGGKKTVSYPVLAKAIHKTAVNNELENVAWMYAPMGKVVDIEIPVRVNGEDICPGIKRGGFVRYVRWSITCRCKVPHIPSEIPLNVSTMGLGDKIFPADIKVDLESLGIQIREKHMDDPIIMISEGES